MKCRWPASLFALTNVVEFLVTIWNLSFLGNDNFVSKITFPWHSTDHIFKIWSFFGILSYFLCLQGSAKIRTGLQKQDQIFKKDRWSLRVFTLRISKFHHQNLLGHLLRKRLWFRICPAPWFRRPQEACGSLHWETRSVLASGASSPPAIFLESRERRSWSQNNWKKCPCMIIVA